MQLKWLVIPWGATVFSLLPFCPETSAQGFVGNSKLTAEMVELLQTPEIVVVCALEDKHAKADEPSFYGWHMLVKSDLRVKGEQLKFGQLLIDSISPASVAIGPFKPRNGLSFLSRNRRLDLVVGSDCRQIQIYFPNGEYWNEGCLEGFNVEIEKLLCRALAAQKTAELGDSILEHSSQHRSESVLTWSEHALVIVFSGLFLAVLVFVNVHTSMRSRKVDFNKRPSPDVQE